MSAKLTKWAKARLTTPEYAALAARAGLAGVTVSAYLRDLITAEREQFDAREAMVSLEERLRRDIGAANGGSEALLVEAVLLSRELLALREPQALARVRAQLDSRFPGRARV
jgi:hypothetical protein